MGVEVKTKISGIRPGEKLHEDMLAKTELPFTYEVAETNLLQVRPQYTSKKYQSFNKYSGQEFNSSLWVQHNTEKLVCLINKGLSYS